ncbi:MAG: DUF2075 domain-containing protein, partial [Schleiferiaceae bacterium]|nr:DUF2075 domain-containing protein [Schleiferiaceae bacterium]
MIVYEATKQSFLLDVSSGRIDDIISERFAQKLHRKVAASERESWRNSLLYMHMVLMGDYGIPNDTGVCVEFTLPPTSKRIDFLLSGTNTEDKSHAIIVELKQWTQVETTTLDGLVRTPLGGNLRETSHPSYQAYSYAQTLTAFNENVYTNKVAIVPCAYAHNLADATVLRDPRYKSYTDAAPVFISTEIAQLQDFIKKHLHKGDSGAALFTLQNGRIKPSKTLADALSGLLDAQPEFILLDDQKVVYERILHIALQNAQTTPATTTTAGTLPAKNVFIVRGGPGTGKSVVAINALVALIGAQLNAAYVSKNAAPREVYKGKLLGVYTKTKYDSLFLGSGKFTEVPQNAYDCLIVDEAHRLNEKSGLYSNLGENQVKEIIQSARTSIFFLDENQKVALSDIGTEDEIRHWAQQAHATVHTDDLTSQFRCGGSDAYLAWLDNTLGIRDTAHPVLPASEFDFTVASSPTELFQKIYDLNATGQTARVVAGYCYPWRSKKDPAAADIVFPDHHFAKQWNLTQHGSAWIANPDSIHQIGCIHTCQGLEVEHIGVIIGKDLIVHTDELTTNFLARDRHDKTLKGAKTLLRTQPDTAAPLIDSIIRNTYRTLLTRGIKSCTVWAEDPALNAWFQER